MAEKVNVTTGFLNNVVDIVQFAESLMTKQAALEAALPSLVDALVDNGLVSATKKSAVLESMKDPAYLTDSFAKVAGYVRPPELGEGVDATNSVKVADNKRESDTVFENMILGKSDSGRDSF
jgi:hypothetical protein